MVNCTQASGNGRSPIPDKQMEKELMHLRRQLSNIVKLAIPALENVEDLLQLPEDKRIKIER
jgi:hypothetical protein